MDLQTKIGQRMICGFRGQELTEEFKEAVRKYKVGNVILFKHNISDGKQLKALCDEIREFITAETGQPPLIGIDQEGGIVTRLPKDCVNTPGAMALAATGKEEVIEEAAYLTAKELRAFGINMDYAPDADVNSNINNPIIGCRSFGDNPKEVATRVSASLRGFEKGKVMATAKHFPGHGDTSMDSHVSLPMIDKSYEELKEVELVPFEAMVKEGCPAFMTTHILFPQIEKENIPATMSRTIMTGLLREKMGYKGLITTDCMEMAAIQTYYGTGKGCAAAMAAGVDFVMISHTVSLIEEAVEEIKKQIEEGKISLKEMDESIDRILKYKKEYCLEPEGEWGTKEAFAAERKIRRSTFSLVGGEIPKPGEKPCFVGCADYRVGNVANVEVNKTTSAGFLASKVGGEPFVTTKDPDEEEITKAVEFVKGHTSVYINTYNGHLYEGQKKIVERIGELGIPMCVFALANPYDLAFLPKGAAGVAAWDYSNETLEEIANVILGEFEPTGKIPCALS